MFTGDDSGHWLYRSMHKAGFASRPTAIDRDDGLTLIDCAITAVGHCAPPDNKPSAEEIANCRAFFEETVRLSQARVFLALGGVAWREMFRLFRQRGWHAGSVPKFAHGQLTQLSDGRHALASYHSSRQNTNTGRLTEAMLDGTFSSAPSYSLLPSSAAQAMTAAATAAAMQASFAPTRRGARPKPSSPLAQCQTPRPAPNATAPKAISSAIGIPAAASRLHRPRLRSPHPQCRRHWRSSRIPRRSRDNVCPAPSPAVRRRRRARKKSAK